MKVQNSTTAENGCCVCVATDKMILETVIEE